MQDKDDEYVTNLKMNVVIFSMMVFLASNLFLVVIFGKESCV